MGSISMRCFARAAALCGLLGFAASPALATPPVSGPAFVESTADMGITEFNSSWGSSWGDADGDGDPDLYISNHSFFPSLYMNHSTTLHEFLDIAPFVLFDFGDAHGAQWADFDNDGDQDLLQLSGAGGQLTPAPNRFFVKTGFFTYAEEAVQRGIDLPFGRGRNPLMFDYNGDGLLDLLYTALARDDGEDPAGLFEQLPDGTFTRIPNALPDDPLFQEPVLAMLTDLTLDGKMEIGTFNRMVEPPAEDAWKMLDVSAVPFTDITPQTGPPEMGGIMDIATYDVNGDLLPDQFFVRAAQDGSDLVQISPTQFQARVHPFDGGEGIDYTTTGDTQLLIPANWFWGLFEIYIGANGYNPPSFTFTLDESNPDHQGLKPFVQGVDRGIYIGYDTTAGKWQLRVSGQSELNVVIHTQDVIDEIVALGFTYPAFTSMQARLFQLQPGGFVETTEAAGLPVTPCVSVAGGDFDNDMDVDFYLACTRTITNAPNVLLENDGTGAFTEVPLAGGAEGSTLGRGESVSTADYDVDGFLDLFVANGAGWPPFNYGPHQLFHNVGNTNHWLMIDLQGVHSNRDGIGARIFATAGGKTQLREANGGMHNRVQDHKRIHFGMGTNTIVSEVVVEWPSGIVQTLTNVPVDKVRKIREPGAGCDVEIAQPVFVQGETITLSRARFNNPTVGIPFAGQIRLTLEIPSGAVFPLFDIGGDGSLTLVPGTLFDPAPLGLIQVTPSFPSRGTFKARCEVEDPATGRILASDTVSFEVQ